MALSPGTRVGSYEVVALIGEGGMGQVWRAHHTVLGRDDALKVLPDALASEPDRLARFQREAQVLASLNHANIAHVYGLEQGNASTVSGLPVRALVMELVEGPTLADRIAEGPLPLDEALAIARQIADALEAAHERGVIHRDLKPANIKVRSDGTVKVLDFGLAKMLDVEARSSVASMSPTITTPALMTGAGVILGTAAYMAPEQARGKAVDTRADIWAFGVVLYEMVAGARPFRGEDVTDTLASVVKVEPDLTDVPKPLQRLLKKCLEKDPRKRLRDIGDVWELLDAEPAPLRSSTRRAQLAAWVAIGTLLAALAALAFVHFRERPPRQQAIQFSLAAPPGTSFGALFGGFAPSPDGRYVVFSASADKANVLWLRPLDSMTARVLTGTENGNNPTWSPDSQSLAFYSEGKLKRIDIAGGAPLTLADVAMSPVGPTGTWNRDGVILFGSAAGLQRVSSAGGGAALLTEADRGAGERGHGFPQFLPDGNRFLYFVDSSDPIVQGVYASSLDNPKRRQRVMQTSAKAVYVPAGGSHPSYLLWLQEQTLLAQRFDAATLTREGNPVSVAEDIGLNPSFNTQMRAAFWASDSGLLVYFAEVGDLERPLVWMSRDGKDLGRSLPDAVTGGQALSPDAQRLAFTRSLAEGITRNWDVWVWEFARQTMTRLTSGAPRDGFPLWSPDGRQIVFASDRDGRTQLYRKDGSGTGQEERLTDSPRANEPLDWSRDGRYILYRELKTAENYDLMALPLTGDRQPKLLVGTPFNESAGRFSPDGSWLAYVSNETGRQEVYVQKFEPEGTPQPEGRWQISNAGGGDMKWSLDGRELYYEAPGGKLMAVAVQAGPSGFRYEAPRELFTADYDQRRHHSFDVTHDGQRFLLIQRPPQRDSLQLTIVSDWRAALRSR
jgi:eukaryotic-like serine/threonine-protein kinase